MVILTEPVARPTKSAERIDARLPAVTKALIERAAMISGVTLSDFVISHAFEAARELVREHETWTLTQRDSRAFVDALLNPPEPNAALRVAAERYKQQFGTDPA